MTNQRDHSLRGKWERIKYGAKAIAKKPFTLFEKDGNGGWDTHATVRISFAIAFLVEWMHHAFIIVPILISKGDYDPTDLVFHPDFYQVTMLISIMGLEKVLDVILQLKHGITPPFEKKKRE